MGRTATGVGAGLMAALMLAGCAGGGTPAPPPATTPATSAANATPTELRPERLDVAYVDDGTDQHKLDLFLPEDHGPGPFPLVVWVHGGGWKSGDKADLSSDDIKVDELKAALLEHGYAVAAPNYGLVPDATFPEPMQDVAAAVRYLRGNAAALGLDPDRFALAGESAGAHLAAMTAFTPTRKDLQGTLGQGGTDASVDAFVGYYGLYDLTTRTDEQRANCGGGKAGGESSHGRLVGADPESPQGEKVAAAASPITYVRKGSPPTLLLQGTQDCTAPHQQARALHAALLEAGVPTELTLVDKGHADASYYDTPKLREQVLAFLDAHVTR